MLELGLIMIWSDYQYVKFYASWQIQQIIKHVIMNTIFKVLYIFRYFISDIDFLYPIIPFFNNNTIEIDYNTKLIDLNFAIKKSIYQRFLLFFLMELNSIREFILIGKFHIQ